MMTALVRDFSARVIGRRLLDCQQPATSGMSSTMPTQRRTDRTLSRLAISGSAGAGASSRPRRNRAFGPSLSGAISERLGDRSAHVVKCHSATEPLGDVARTRHGGHCGAVTDEEQVAEVREWFASKGFELRVEERDMSAELRGLTARHRYWVDLISVRSGGVSMRSYGSGMSETVAIVVAEQRWLAEQEGTGSTAGATYVEKAEERLRRGREAAR